MHEHNDIRIDGVDPCFGGGGAVSVSISRR